MPPAGAGGAAVRYRSNSDPALRGVALVPPPGVETRTRGCCKVGIVLRLGRLIAGAVAPDVPGGAADRRGLLRVQQPEVRRLVGVGLVSGRDLVAHLLARITPVCSAGWSRPSAPRRRRPRTARNPTWARGPRRITCRCPLPRDRPGRPGEVLPRPLRGVCGAAAAASASASAGIRPAGPPTIVTTWAAAASPVGHFSPSNTSGQW